MMLNEASAPHLSTSANNIYTRKSSKLTIQTLKKIVNINVPS